MKTNLIYTVLLFALFTAITCTPKTPIYYEGNKVVKPRAKQPRKSNAKPFVTVYAVHQNGIFKQTELDKKPEPIAGEKAFYRAMYTNIKYPPAARKGGVGGTVLITVIVNEFGQLEHSEIKEGIGAGCDEVALNAVRAGFQLDFSPAIKDGKAVKVKYDVPVKFRLE